MTTLERKSKMNFIEMRLESYKEVLPQMNRNNLLVYFGCRLQLCEIVKETAKTITVQVPGGESYGQDCPGHRAKLVKSDLKYGREVIREKYGQRYCFRFGVPRFKREIQCAIRLLDPRERRRHQEELRLQRELANELAQLANDVSYYDDDDDLNDQYKSTIRWQDAGF